MIQLTRLNNKPLIVNSDLIKFVEQAPDTLVTLISGEKIVVLEKPDEVLARIIQFRRAVLEHLSLAWDASGAHAFVGRSPAAGSHEPER
jgi:flagellar protein FlbD